MLYKIEHKILTLSNNAVMENKEFPASFIVEDIIFSHWAFDYRDGWQKDFWLAKGEIEAFSAFDAINQFRKKLGKIIPRISLIGQSYTEFTREPWLIKKIGSEVSLYHHITDISGIGLMFMESDKKALDILLKSEDVPDSFYHYWNDAVNSLGYSPKLLLMFSALESLVKKSNKKKDWEKINKILGNELQKDLYGTIENPESGLRHRLVHGEYFSSKDSEKDYLTLIHKKVLSYFNKEILKEELLELGVVHPQRHPFGNKEGGYVFMENKIEPKLVEVNSTFNEDDPDNDKKHGVFYPDNEFRTSF